MPVDMEESAISLKDLLRRCLERWKLLLICALVGAVLMNFIGIYQEKKTAEEAEANAAEEAAPEEQSTEEETATLTAAEYKKQLTKQETADVEDVFEVYRSYRKQYDQYSEYFADSIYMKLDPQNTAYTYLEYLVDDHYTVEYPVISKRDMRDVAVQQYVEQLSAQDTYDQMAKVLDADGDDVDVPRYISAWNGGNGLLYVKVLAADEETRDALVQIVKQKVEGSTGKVQELCGSFDITLAQEKNYVGQLDEVQDTQNNIRSTLIAYRDRTYGLASNMTETQTNYYSALIREMDKQNKGGAAE